MTSRERVIKSFKHLNPDKIPFFELGIDENIASKIMGKELFLYDRTYRFKHKLFYDYKDAGYIDSSYIMEAIKNTCDLYGFLDIDIIPVRIYSSYVAPFSLIYMGLTDSFDNIILSEQVNSEYSESWKIKDSEGFWTKLNFNRKNKTIFMQDDSICQGGIKELKRFNKNARRKLGDLLPKLDLASDDNELSHSIKILPRQIAISLECLKFSLDYSKTKDRFILGYGSLCFPSNATFNTLFLESMISDPDTVFEYLEVTTEGIIPVIEAQLKLGADAIICVNDYAYNSGPIFSPAHFLKFLVPFYKRISDLCHRYGKQFIKHCDGNINSLIGMFIDDCGFDGIHAIEPSAGMDIYALKRQFGERITLIGNLDCSALLVNGSNDDISNEIYRLIKYLSPGGGYIFSSSNSIHSGVGSDNFMTMVKVFKEARDNG